MLSYHPRLPTKSQPGRWFCSRTGFFNRLRGFEEELCSPSRSYRLLSEFLVGVFADRGPEGDGEAASENVRKRCGYTTMSTFSLANKVAAEGFFQQPAWEIRGKRKHFFDLEQLSNRSIVPRKRNTSFSQINFSGETGFSH